MQYIDGLFQFSDIHEVSGFAKFLERVDVLSLKNEIKTEQGIVLVQAQKTLTENLIRNLLTRSDLSKDSYLILSTENLKMAIVNKITKEILTRLDLSDYSFCSFLLHRQTIDMKRIIRGSLNNSFFLGYITEVFLSNFNILNHLIEISLLSLGLLVNTNDKSISYTDLIKSFQAGMLHDLTLTKNRQWANDDIFIEDVSHDRESALKISDKNLTPEVSEIILASNKLQNKYPPNKDLKWYSKILDLQIAILNLAEYFSYITRLNESEHENDMKVVIYQLSLITEKGFFPRQLVGLFETFFAKYSSIFRYAEQIGQIEKKCIMNPSIASAYPKPKSTQLLCKNSTLPCEYRIYSQPLKVISEKRTGHNIIETLNSGWYDKCKFTSFLPVPPKEI